MELETVLTIGAGGGLVWGATYVAQNVYDRLFERWVQFKSRRLEFAKREQELRLSRVRVMRPDEHGRQGIIFDGQIYRNLDTMAVFDQIKIHYFDPLMEQVNVMQKTLLAMQGVNHQAVTQVLEAGQGEATELMWPARVRLADLLDNRRPSVNDLIIGVRPREQGGLDVVSVGIHELMHTLAVGVSGWGKSTWLRSLLWQIAQVQEPVEVVAVDAYGSEFNLLQNWSKLHWPVARTIEEAKLILEAVSGEIKRRKELFETNAPIASKLVEYNRATGAELPPWLVVIDEGTALLNQPGVGEPLRAAVQTARQYGVYILVAGQSAKHSVIDTQTRDNFTSRLCFRTSPTSSQVVLDDRGANKLKDKGRMIVQLVGREQMELQGPFVTRQEFMRALDDGGPRRDLPSLADEPAEDDGLVEQVRTMHAQGESLRSIQKALFGYVGGAAYDQVKHILAEG